MNCPDDQHEREAELYHSLNPEHAVLKQLWAAEQACRRAADDVVWSWAQRHKDAEPDLHAALEQCNRLPLEHAVHQVRLAAIKLGVIPAPLAKRFDPRTSPTYCVMAGHDIEPKSACD